MNKQIVPIKLVGKLRISEFLDEIASKSPTPGGGAVAAMTAATAAALVEMVINLTKGEKLKVHNLKIKEFREKLLQLADEDVAAFDAVMEAYRSKDKQSLASQGPGKEKIKKALEGAIVVPRETKEYACLVEEIAKLVEKEGNKNAVSDARSAIYLAQAAQKAAQENIDINERALADLK